MSRNALDALTRTTGALLRALPVERWTMTGSRRSGVLADGGRRRDEDDDHLRDVPDGAGCTEIWEYLSERQTTEGERRAAEGERQAAEGECDD